MAEGHWMTVRDWSRGEDDAGRIRSPRTSLSPLAPPPVGIARLAESGAGRPAHWDPGRGVKLQGRWGSSSVEDLGSAVSVAERVKFGGYGSGIEMAEGHWMTVGDWIEGRGED